MEKEKEEEVKRYLLEFFKLVGMHLNDKQVDNWYKALKEQMNGK